MNLVPFTDSFKLPYFQVVLAIVLALPSCNSNSDHKKAIENKFSECKYGKPQAIFSDTLQHIEAHHFTMQGKAGIEQVEFDHGVQLELIQTGCNQIRQEFRFDLPGNHDEKNTADWVRESHLLFRYMGTLSEAHVSLTFWGNALLDQIQQIKMGQALALAPGFSATLDKIPGTDQTTLIVVLEEIK